jgi:hypothetical protein
MSKHEDINYWGGAAKVRTKTRQWHECQDPCRKRHQPYAPSYNVRLEFGERKMDGITKRGTK